ncbi:MAG: hypothetical protein ABI602_01370 [Candidatus Saccharibacteria bacterium]
MGGPKSAEPYPGAQPFEGLEVPRAVFAPERRRAFGSVPRLLGVNLELSLQVNRADKAHATTENLQSALYGRVDQAVNGLVLNPAEYSVILINASSFEDRLGARAEAAHAHSNPIRRAEAKIDAPLHAYRDPGGLLAKHIGQVASLTAETDKLAELAAYIHVPGYAQTTESNLRLLATYAWEHSFDNLLRVAANRQDWTLRERHGAAESMAARLASGPQTQRVGYWGELTGLALNYANRKRALFTQRQHLIETRIKLISQQRDVFDSTHGITRIT